MSNRDELHSFAEAQLMQTPLALKFRLRQGVSGEFMSFRLSPEPDTLLHSRCSSGCCKKLQGKCRRRLIFVRDRSRHVKFHLDSNTCGVGEMGDETGLREYFQISEDHLISQFSLLSFSLSQ
jgi:hypothetical protein